MSTRAGLKTSIGAYPDPHGVKLSYRKRVSACELRAVCGTEARLTRVGGGMLTARVTVAATPSSTPPPIL